MANEGSAKPTYSELIKCSCDPMNLAEPCDWCLGMAARRTLPLLESELARVRRLLQRIHELFVWRVSPNKEGYHLVEADVVRETIRSSAPETPIPQGTYRILVPDPARDWKVLYKSAAKRADDYYNIIQELDKLLTTFRQSSSLSEQGAESADVGKLDTVDKSGVEMGKVNRVGEAPSGSAAYRQEHVEMQRRIKNQRQQLAKAYKDLEEKNRRIEYLEPFRQQVQGIAGSAETGGEKAAPPQFCQCANDWTDGTGWCQECHLERKSIEPEKLNNAPESVLNLVRQHIQFLERAVANTRLHDAHRESFRPELEELKAFLAESSLSSPPPLEMPHRESSSNNDKHPCPVCGNLMSLCSVPKTEWRCLFCGASPELLPTQLPKEK